jgi:branched-chain amino acid transport system ATP-binding protein
MVGEVANEDVGNSTVDRTVQGGGILELNTVDTYYGESHILSDVSFSLGESEVVAVLGRNGAGKTTLIKSIMGMLAIESGTIRFKDVDISGMSIVERSRLGLSIVPEDRRIIPNLTVEEMLRISANQASGSSWELSRLYDLFPVLDNRTNQTGGSMSGGEQQMLAIARALVQNTECLLLDEPFEGLAPQIVSQVQDRIETIKDEDMSILIVEQSVNEVLDLADRVLILHGGQIVEEKDPETLQANPEVYEQYLGV